MRATAGNESYIQEVIQSLGFQKIKRQPNGFLAVCKFHDDHHPSFSIGHNGLWKCFACPAKGNLKQLHARLGVDGFDWRESLKILGIQLSSQTNGSSVRKKRKTLSLPTDFEPYEYPKDVPGVISERLSWETIAHYSLGKCTKYPNAGRCVIPIRYKGKFVGYHGRSVSPKVNPKYYNPGDFKMKDHVFNYDGCREGEDIIIVEGAFNAMSMWEKGFRNTLATFGVSFGAQQLKKIFDLNPSSITICFDRDPSKIVDGDERGKSGQKATSKLGELLDDVITTWVMPLPIGQDPNDLPVETLKQYYAKRFRFDRIRRKHA